VPKGDCEAANKATVPRGTGTAGLVVRAAVLVRPTPDLRHVQSQCRGMRTLPNGVHRGVTQGLSSCAPAVLFHMGFRMGAGGMCPQVAAPKVTTTTATTFARTGTLTVAPTTATTPLCAGKVRQPYAASASFGLASMSHASRATRVPFVVLFPAPSVTAAERRSNRGCSRVRFCDELRKG